MSTRRRDGQALGTRHWALVGSQVRRLFLVPSAKCRVPDKAFDKLMRNFHHLSRAETGEELARADRVELGIGRLDGEEKAVL